MPRVPNRRFSTVLEVANREYQFRGEEEVKVASLKPKFLKRREGDIQTYEEAGQEKGLIETGCLSSLQGRGKSQQAHEDTGSEETGRWLRAGWGQVPRPRPILPLSYLWASAQGAQPLAPKSGYRTGLL